MVAFEICVNQEVLCTAGIGEDGVLTSILTWVKRKNEIEHCDIAIAGMTTATQEHVKWTVQPLSSGDVVRIRVIETEKVDSPSVRQRRDPTEDVERQKAYVRDMAERFGWTIQT